MNIENKETTTGDQDFTSCPDWGKGGRFVVDSTTGLRVRAQPEPALQEPAPVENIPQEPETKKTTSKENRRG